jgi:hypothetical protein
MDFTEGEASSSYDEADYSDTEEEEASTLSTESCSSVGASPSKRRKGSKAWVYTYLEETNERYECRLCRLNPEVEEIRKLSWPKTKKLFSHNVARHLERRHRHVLISDGLISPKPTDEYSKEELHLDLMEWICHAKLPLTTTEDAFLQRIFNRLGRPLLMRDQMTGTYLPKLYQQCIETTSAQLPKGPYSITSDGWTTSKHKDVHWCSITVHWIED